MGGCLGEGGMGKLTSMAECWSRRDLSIRLNCSKSFARHPLSWPVWRWSIYNAVSTHDGFITQEGKDSNLLLDGWAGAITLTLHLVASCRQGTLVQDTCACPQTFVRFHNEKTQHFMALFSSECENVSLKWDRVVFIQSTSFILYPINAFRKPSVNATKKHLRQIAQTTSEKLALKRRKINCKSIYPSM